MPVSEHPIIVTVIDPDRSLDLTGYDEGEMTRRAAAYVLSRIAFHGSGSGKVLVRIATNQDGVKVRMRKTIETAVSQAKEQEDP